MPRKLKIDKAQVRRFYNFLPWRNRALTMLLLKPPGRNRPLLRALARDRDEFLDLVVNRPSDTALDRPRDLYVCVNPVGGERRDYYSPDPTIPGTKWPKSLGAARLNTESIAERRMIGVDLDRGGGDRDAPVETANVLVGVLGLDSYMMVSSGSGCHLWIPVPRQPKYAWSKELLDEFLRHEAGTELQGVKLDKQPLAAFSVLRVPGTWNTKEPDRPRQVSIIDCEPPKGTQPNRRLLQRICEFAEGRNRPVLHVPEDMQRAGFRPHCEGGERLPWDADRASQCAFIRYFESGVHQDMGSWLDLARGLTAFKDGKRHFRRLSRTSPSQWNDRMFEQAWRWAERTRLPLCETLSWDPDGGRDHERCPKLGTCPVRSFPYLIGLPQHARKPAVPAGATHPEADAATMDDTLEWLQGTLASIIGKLDSKVHLI